MPTNIICHRLVVHCRVFSVNVVCAGVLVRGARQFRVNGGVCSGFPMRWPHSGNGGAGVVITWLWRFRYFFGVVLRGGGPVRRIPVIAAFSFLDIKDNAILPLRAVSAFRAPRTLPGPWRRAAA